MPSRKPTVFFAIPCGEFYSIQHKIIQQVGKTIGIKPIVVEDHSQTKDLWNAITNRIDDADLFIADISSGSFNIALELGYALRQKLEQKVGIFISESRPVPADLQGFVRQQFTNLSDFQTKLTTWICESLNLPKPQTSEPSRKRHQVLFREDFKSQDIFLKHWSTPPIASSLLTHEGLKFYSGMFPILSTTLALLRDCEIEFRARIVREKLGWTVMGTKAPYDISPAFCVMFQIDTNGNLIPHIWNYRQPSAQSYFQIYPGKQIQLNLSKDGWFTLTTKIQGNIISIRQGRRLLFKADFSKGIYSSCYNDFVNREGQIGFRCHPQEEAVINYVEVREIYK